MYLNIQHLLKSVLQHAEIMSLNAMSNVMTEIQPRAMVVAINVRVNNQIPVVELVRIRVEGVV